MAHTAWQMAHAERISDAVTPIGLDVIGFYYLAASFCNSSISSWLRSVMTAILRARK
jgi:hypothetical protein